MLVGGAGVELEDGEGAGCCGGSTTGTPVRECRSGGIIVRDWVVGVRIKRRRGLVMFFTLGFAEAAGSDAGAEWIMAAVSFGCNWGLKISLEKVESDSAQFTPLIVFGGRMWCMEKASSPPHRQKTMVWII